ncbi:MAG TPA: hypothetical protein VGM91_06590, partial [Conexibacter sp.]
MDDGDLAGENVNADAEPAAPNTTSAPAMKAEHATGTDRRRASNIARSWVRGAPRRRDLPS